MSVGVEFVMESPLIRPHFTIASEVMSAWRFAKRIRHHRLIENTLHWTKDVVLHEDTCGLKKPISAVNMAVVRNISFNLLVMDGYL